jgi:uncharacterized membrane protein YbhN (UPF0104 family)
MASASHLAAHLEPDSATRHDTTRPESLAARLVRLATLEVELGWAETRTVVRRVVVALAVAIPAAIALLAAIIVVVAGAIAPLFDAPWQHLVIAGGAVGLAALAALAWSAWRLTHMTWPQQTLASLQETWRWLAAQLRSKLTLR